MPHVQFRSAALQCSPTPHLRVQRLSWHPWSASCCSSGSGMRGALPRSAPSRRSSVMLRATWRSWACSCPSSALAAQCLNFCHPKMITTANQCQVAGTNGRQWQNSSGVPHLGCAQG